MVKLLGYVTAEMPEEVFLKLEESMARNKWTIVLQSEKHEIILTEKELIWYTKKRRELGEKPYGIPLGKISECHVEESANCEPCLVLVLKGNPTPWPIYPPRVYTGMEEILNSGNAHTRQMLYVQRWAQAISVQIAKLGKPLRWTCSYCQMANEGNFCSHCGSPRRVEKT
jgi:hypothetical protein